MSMHLFDLDKNWERFDSAMEDLEDLEEMGGELPEPLQAMLDELLKEAGPSLERAGFYRDWLANQREIIKKRKAALSATDSRFKKKEDLFDPALVRVLKRVGTPQRFPEFTLSTQTRPNNEYALAPGAEYFDDGILDFVKAEYTWRKKDLNAALKEGNLPAGIDVVTTSSTSVLQRHASKKAEPTAIEALENAE